MIRKIKYIVLICLLVAIGIIVALFLKDDKNNELESINESDVIPDHIIYDGESFYSDSYIEEHFGVKDLTDEEKKLMIYYENNIFKMLLKMAKGGESWRCYPVIKEIKENYDEDKGILSYYNFDNVEYSQETLDDLAEYGSVSPISFDGTKGKQKKRIYFDILIGDGLENLEQLKVVDLTDDDGNELDIRLKWDKDNYKELTWTLFESNDTYSKYISVSKDFEKKYANIDEMISKNLQDYKTGGTIGRHDTDFEEKSATYYWKTKNKKYLVKVKFIIDNKKCIEDVNVEFLGEFEQ